MTTIAEQMPALAEAAAPAEARGLARDSVRLLTVLLPDGEMRHLAFNQLPDLLDPGDVVVVNTSATRASAIEARREDGSFVTVHLSGPARGGEPDEWLIEMRDGDRRMRGGRSGERLALPGRAEARLISRYVGGRLWLASLGLPAPIDEYLSRHGRPIRYGHTGAGRSISDYQNVYATEPGSAEMPSAGRPFTPELITRLVANGVDVAPLVLHTGVSSLERGEHPQPERFQVPIWTAERVELARRLGGRVIAVGTTVVRALESSTGRDGRVHATRGWTDLVLDRGTPVGAVDGILTGFHDPDASHLELLEAIAPTELIAAAYREAAAAGYHRHEFGDLELIVHRIATPRSRPRWDAVSAGSHEIHGGD